MPLLLFALLCLIWSTTWGAIRVCEQGFSPLWAAAARFVLAALVLAAITWRGRRGRPRIAWWILPLAGLIDALSYGLIFVAEREITGGTGAVLGATNPFFVLAAAAALGWERITLRKSLGLAVGFAGVLLLFGAGVKVGPSMVIAMLEVLFAAAVLWPSYTVLMRRAGDLGWSPPQITSSFITWTAVFLVPAALVFEGLPHPSPTPRSVGALLYLALVGTALAWSLFNDLLRKLPLTVISTMLFIEPALALATDWLLGEKAPGSAAWAGAALILVGVALSAVGAPLPVAPATGMSSARPPPPGGHLERGLANERTDLTLP